jgi:L,D-transpeptidase catalytic domain
MGRHREVRGRPSGRRAAPRTRPRYHRLGAAAVALSVTLVAVLGGIGVLPSEQDAAVAAAGHEPSGADAVGTDDAGPNGAGSMRLTGAWPRAARADERTTGRVLTPAVPVDGGTGRRVVFSMAQQRVWLVGRAAGRETVLRSYLVSGSLTDNLRPGTYSVYSRSMDAVGVDESGTMRYMVRFTRGENAAIGFHDIPELDGRPVQSRAQLGSPQSHGCIRQWRPDAQALWSFAPVGTKVVVVA